MDVELFAFHSTVVGSGLKHRFRVCGSRARGIFPVNPGEMTSSAVIPGPVAASAPGGVCLYVFAQGTESIFFPTQTDWVQDNNTYVPHTALNPLWPSVRMCASE